MTNWIYDIAANMVLTAALQTTPTLDSVSASFLLLGVMPNKNSLPFDREFALYFTD